MAHDRSGLFQGRRVGSSIPILLLFGLGILAFFQPTHIPMAAEGVGAQAQLNPSGLVLLMTPGLAFFYGGMVGKKNIISTMLQSFVCLGLVSLLWVVVGFSLAFGDSYHGLIGNPRT